MAAARFSAQPTTVDGHRFASKREAIRYGELRLLERAGQIAELELQPAFAVEINGKPFCTYCADFAYRAKNRERANGKERIVEEVKSSGTRQDPAYRLRRKAAELYHGIEITEIVRP
jgi:hypothetical protein